MDFQPWPLMHDSNLCGLLASNYFYLVLPRIFRDKLHARWLPKVDHEEELYAKRTVHSFFVDENAPRFPCLQSGWGMSTSDGELNERAIARGTRARTDSCITINDHVHAWLFNKLPFFLSSQFYMYTLHGKDNYEGDKINTKPCHKVFYEKESTFQ